MTNRIRVHERTLQDMLYAINAHRQRHPECAEEIAFVKFVPEPDSGLRPVRIEHDPRTGILQIEDVPL